MSRRTFLPILTKVPEMLKAAGLFAFAGNEAFAGKEDFVGNKAFAGKEDFVENEEFVVQESPKFAVDSVATSSTSTTISAASSSIRGALFGGVVHAAEISSSSLSSSSSSPSSSLTIPTAELVLNNLCDAEDCSSNNNNDDGADCCSNNSSDCSNNEVSGGKNQSRNNDLNLQLDEEFLVAAPDDRGCGKGCDIDDAASRQPFISDPLVMMGAEVDGLDRSMEALAADNVSLNAEEDEDAKKHEEMLNEDYENSKANPFNKSIDTLVDEALRWHEKMSKEPSGRCEPIDQLAEESFGAWVGQADKMFRERKFEDLKEKFEEEYKKTKGRLAKRDPQLCWRMARLTFLMGNEVENNTIAFWKDAMIYAIEGIKNFEDPARIDRVEDLKHINHNCCWKCHLWFGIIMAKLGGLLQKDQRKRIQVAFLAKQHLERAIQINPLDPIPNFALAKWHFEFCKLNAGQLKICRELGKEVPVTDVKTALRYAERANELTPKLIGSRVGKFPRNCYLLAEIYYSMGQYEKAKYFVETLVYQLGPFCMSIEDRRAVERGKVLYMKLNNPTPNNPNDMTPRAGKARPDTPSYPNHQNN